MFMKMAIATFLLGGLAAAGFAVTKRPKYVPDGTWGAVHINVQVENGQATIDYDCAHGTITGPLKIDTKGRFSFLGTHKREGPGPIRVGREFPPLKARYTGWTDGKTMTLTVTLIDTKETVGTYKLTRGQSGRIRKCL